MRSEHAVVAKLAEGLRAASGAAALDRIAGELESHFAYEEEQLVPVLNSLIDVPWSRLEH
ncbi:hemerythrin domain-containing protein [Nonomuraea diastatica]|uniref:Hemerythrin-like domain-containing protein n=1 Tax=Nonomuraea diastatica TaxID=1848329 RepID=A0A4R4WRD9_9ACTN|nr:hemerythrin domain-containing protein [Nonomuraea diastatica]TDD20035.1 hypothetical protein E1294_19170 [Nonomuraea diastatica]